MKYVALLRGINVGGNKKVEMPRLKESFERMDYKNVRTYINSGNVIFESSKKAEERLASNIEKALEQEFGFAIHVLVRSGENIAKVARSVPATWENNGEQKTDVLFLWEKFANKKTIDLIEVHKKVDTLRYIDGAIIWHIDKKDYSKSGMHNFIGTDVYKHMTARNINTVRKLTALLKA